MKTWQGREAASHHLSTNRVRDQRCLDGHDPVDRRIRIGYTLPALVPRRTNNDRVVYPIRDDGLVGTVGSHRACHRPHLYRCPRNDGPVVRVVHAYGDAMVRWRGSGRLRRWRWRRRL